MNSKVKYLIKLSLINLFFIFLTGFSSEIFAKTGINTQSVIGLWQTTDGKTKKPSSIIKIQLQG
ncbi:MAG: hypothetical protein NTU49_10280, partial [Gammaproteobacteria bacterium]|nr:hypothetical protein [Gammaproteobacteria bacterium]